MMKKDRHFAIQLGCVRLTLFRNRNTYNNFNKFLKRFLELLKYKIALKLSCVSKRLQKCLPKFTLKRNLTAISLILILEYGQSNATLNTTL